MALIGPDCGHNQVITVIDAREVDGVVCVRVRGSTADMQATAKSLLHAPLRAAF